MYRLFVISVAFLSVLAFASPRARAHPVHATIGEATWNRSERVLEISIRVRAVDLIEALGPDATLDLASVDPKRVANDDRQVLSYLERTFRITRRGGEKLPLKWLGKEFDLKGKGTHLWLHFWVALGDVNGPLDLTHEIFFELDDGQVNTLEFRHGKDESTSTFSRRQPRQRIPIDLTRGRLLPVKP